MVDLSRRDITSTNFLTSSNSISFIEFIPLNEINVLINQVSYFLALYRFHHKKDMKNLNCHLSN
ncbi:hypothetical protein BSU_19915 [Bacillus subtilis subsp. subtilis str. 168]|uniref:Uncharacterized protein n=1 Tax=Bacillus subtilis (strain 168) TaxID=224308 RepID=A0A2K4Z9J6_BACSU|nr:hypothetical protein BSU_19915 [Bacillus subtilis subsp. subtilis str. 168] [Bacillus subtilis]YP_009513967.1 hypothetical protein BSU_19915 [Bacillus subtilis subsp. subtilis str. 168]SOX90565.1 hypothetical protein BSU_19915 [Bacillus subtilis subsp. subtilis str. 168]